MAIVSFVFCSWWEYAETKQETMRVESWSRDNPDPEAVSGSSTIFIYIAIYVALFCARIQKNTFIVVKNTTSTKKLYNREIIE